MKELGLRTRGRCVGLVPCCGQDGSRALVPQHPIETQQHMNLGLFQKAVENINSLEGENEIILVTINKGKIHVKDFNFYL